MLRDSNGDGHTGNGTYRLHAIAYDFDSIHSTDIGQVTILVDNTHSHLPFGTIDTPSDGGNVPGSAAAPFVNFAWALTPLQNTIPIDGSTIQVVIDGQVSHPNSYNNYRSDIATLFPGLNNSNGAVGFYYLDPTPYMPLYPKNNSLHTISWNVYDNAGNGQGIGSRFFRTSGPVTTAEYDINRTGANQNEVTLTPQNVNATQFGLLGSYTVNGCVYAHPLYMPHVLINGAYSNVLYVATSNNFLYAFDADHPNTDSLIVPRNLGSATAPGDGDIVDCNATPSVTTGPSGIIGTPVIASGTGGAQWMWFVSGTGGQYYLHAADITTLADAISPVLIAATGFNASVQLQRPGLLIDPNDPYHVVIGFASYGDNNHDDNPGYQGWVFSYSKTGTLAGAMNLSPTGDSGAAVWMSGGGLASDGNYIYFTTGNNKTNFDKINGSSLHTAGTPPSWGLGDYSNSIMQLGLTGLFAGAWVPPNSYRGLLDGCDCDIGSSRIILVPGSKYGIAGGKNGDFYIVQRTPLMSSNSLVRQLNGMCIGGEAMYNGFAYWNNKVYTWCSGDYLKARSFNNLLSGITDTLSTAGNLQGAFQQGYQGANIAISSSGATNGIVWATVPDNPTTITDQTLTSLFHTGHLFAYDANTLAQLTLPASSNLNALYYQKLTPPVIANGKVYVVTASGKVLLYGLGGH
jgi:hypothetical protein